MSRMQGTSPRESGGNGRQCGAKWTQLGHPGVSVVVFTNSHHSHGRHVGSRSRFALGFHDNVGPAPHVLRCPPTAPLPKCEDRREWSWTVPFLEPVCHRTKDYTARLWLLQVEDLFALARDTVGRNLSTNEWRTVMPGQPYFEVFPGLPIPLSVGLGVDGRR